jgi:hypothetical protein
MARAIQTAVDSLNFFVESRNVGNLINVTSTATLGGNSGDLTNTNQQGALFFLTLASLSVNTATLGLSILAKNISASTYFPWARVSLDGLVNAASLQYMAMLYIGANITNVSVGPSANTSVAFSENMQIIPLPVPAVFQVATTLTITTTASMSGSISYRVDYEKIM